MIPVQTKPEIRPTVPDDAAEIVDVAIATRVFKPLEISTLREVLDDYFDENAAIGHRCHTLTLDGVIVGFAYHAPIAMTEDSWYLYWIAVQPRLQTRGIGSLLLQMVEEDIVRHRGRVLFIETSSLPHYEKTRRFYLKHGYDREAVLRDFYAAGDDMIVFRKQLAGSSKPQW